MITTAGSGGARCVACGEPARGLTPDEAMDRVRGSMRSLFGDDDLTTVNARIQAVREVGDMLRYLQAVGVPPRDVEPEAPQTLIPQLP